MIQEPINLQLKKYSTSKFLHQRDKIRAKQVKEVKLKIKDTNNTRPQVDPMIGTFGSKLEMDSDHWDGLKV